MHQSLRQRYGEWAVVTGASDGIGREFARALASGAVNLVLVARRLAPLEAVAAELSSAHGVECRVMDADLTTDLGVNRVVSATAQLDVGLLVAAAGFGTSGPFIASPLGGEQEMLAVNCRAVLMLSHEFASRFVARGRGGLVLMSSLLAFQGTPRAAHYAATKAYIQTLAEGLREELRPLGVDVIACAPGPIHSGFGTRADMQMSFAQAPEVVARKTLRALGRRNTVRPGWLSKFLEMSLSMLPRWGRVKVMGLVMRGMTAHHGVRDIPDNRAA